MADDYYINNSKQLKNQHIFLFSIYYVKFSPFFAGIFLHHKILSHEKSIHSNSVLPVFGPGSSGNSEQPGREDEYHQDQCHGLYVQKYQSLL